jgi:hypothetical protein
MDILIALSHVGTTLTRNIFRERWNSLQGGGGVVFMNERMVEGRREGGGEQDVVEEDGTGSN